MTRILLCQLGSYGDCLYATTIARQIKEDYPDCHLTWAIGSKYKNILNNNPHVDEVWEYPISNRLELKTKWFEFVKEVLIRKEQGDFDKVYFTQAYPGNPQHFRDVLRASMFRAYENPITVPIDPVIQLSVQELDSVFYFVEVNRIANYTHRILFEWSPESGQSFVTSGMVLEVVKEIINRFPDACIILSGTDRIGLDNPNIIDGGALTFRENAELTKYCTLFIGTGSGITQICTSDWAKPLPMIQLLQKGTVASLINDREYFRLPVDNIIEMTNCTSRHVIDCITSVILNGFAISRQTYCERIYPDFNIIRFHMRFDSAVITGQYLEIIPAFITACKEYGLNRGLLGFLSTFPASIIILIRRKIEG